MVIKGQASIKVRKLFSDKVHDFNVSGDRPVFVDMPALHTHNITNTGDSELLTLFWSNEIFDPENPDTYQETV
jgi:UDP-2-acetamido-2,6-beta-L-arabino-hexul-4-ose reductase